jgi:hypothetical protein
MKKERMSRILDPSGLSCPEPVGRGGVHFVLAAFLSFLASGVLSRGVNAMVLAPGSSWTTREELFDWFRDLGLDVEGVV